MGIAGVPKPEVVEEKPAEEKPAETASEEKPKVCLDFASAPFLPAKFDVSNCLAIHRTNSRGLATNT